MAIYWRAHKDADVDVFPVVLFVAVDEWRADELKWIISKLPSEPDADGVVPQSLFQVTTNNELASLFG